MMMSFCCQKVHLIGLIMASPLVPRCGAAAAAAKHSVVAGWLSILGIGQGSKWPTTGGCCTCAAGSVYRGMALWLWDICVF